MEAKAGDRVALDGKKVGQPKRTGLIKEVTKGLSGNRYHVSWDDGTSSIIAPNLGNLTVQAKKAKSSNGKNKASTRTKAKAKAKKTKR
jgi:hypothetical protein